MKKSGSTPDTSYSLSPAFGNLLSATDQFSKYESTAFGWEGRIQSWRKLILQSWKDTLQPSRTYLTTSFQRCFGLWFLNVELPPVTGRSHPAISRKADWCLEAFSNTDQLSYYCASPQKKFSKYYSIRSSPSALKEQRYCSAEFIHMQHLEKGLPKPNKSYMRVFLRLMRVYACFVKELCLFSSSLILMMHTSFH